LDASSFVGPWPPACLHLLLLPLLLLLLLLLCLLPLLHLQLLQLFASCHISPAAAAAAASCRLPARRHPWALQQLQLPCQLLQLAS
jgi:hypothetical protein